jgi:uncharacterized membrane protein YqaE (UPF0057 family)
MRGILLIIVAFFLPPLAVFMVSGASRDFWINIVLTLLLWFPGFLHAMVLVLNTQERAVI